MHINVVAVVATTKCLPTNEQTKPSGITNIVEPIKSRNIWRWYRTRIYGEFDVNLKSDSNWGRCAFCEQFVSENSKYFSLEKKFKSVI